MYYGIKIETNIFTIVIYEYTLFFAIQISIFVAFSSDNQHFIFEQKKKRFQNLRTFTVNCALSCIIVDNKCHR